MATEFKDRLRELRKSRTLSQKELATILDVSKGLIAQYETGKRFPSRAMLEEIADLFNVSIDYLTGREKGSIYYLDPEVARIAQEIYDNKGLRMLFDTARKATKEDLQVMIEISKRLFGND